MLNGIRQALLDDTDVAALVGTKIYSGRIGQADTFPQISLFVVDINPDDDKDGPSDLDVVKVQVSSYDEDYQGAYTVADKARRALERLSATKNGVQIQSIRFIDQTDILVENAGVNGVNNLAFDYMVRIIRT